METKLAIAACGVIIAGAIPAILGSIWGALLTAVLAFIAASVFAVLNPAIGAVAWLLSLTPTIFIIRANAIARRDAIERRHRDVLAAIRANGPAAGEGSSSQFVAPPSPTPPVQPRSLDFDPNRVAAVLDAISAKKA